MTREEFRARQDAIIRDLEGDAAHRAFDDLCAETLRFHGYDPSPFEDASLAWHWREAA